MERLDSPALTPTSQHAGTTSDNSAANRPGATPVSTDVPLGTYPERVTGGQPAGETTWRPTPSAAA